MINMLLAEQLSLSSDVIDEIQKLQDHIDRFCKEPQAYCDVEDVVETLKQYNAELQALWGFPINPNYDRYWYRVKYCICPVMDNDEMLGQPFGIYYKGCVYHGSNPAKTWEEVYERFE